MTDAVPDRREVTPVLGSFTITGRGSAYVTIDPDPLYELGEEVLMAGRCYRITAIERFAIPRKPGQKISLFLREVEV